MDTQTLILAWLTAISTFPSSDSIDVSNERSHDHLKRNNTRDKRINLHLNINGAFEGVIFGSDEASSGVGTGLESPDSGLAATPAGSFEARFLAPMADSQFLPPARSAGLHDEQAKPHQAVKGWRRRTGGAG
nr:hypothetical protein Iba_chr06aCG16210 [Ipomoea batatas]